MSQLPKVTVVGRNTMGILDYSNVSIISFQEFKFIYPTSRRLAIDSKKGMSNRGIPVDVYVPWTPDHLKNDIDLYVVNEMIKRELKDGKLEKRISI